jgi:sucrose-6-phosphate hydrolase SacC (GH32 family)
MKFRQMKNRWSATMLVGLGFLAAPGLRAADDLVITDFEGVDYGAWKATGTAFGPGPAQGTLPGQMAVAGFAGKGLVNSFFQGDGSTGTLTSPEFKIERPYISFLIGGGMDAEKTCMALLVDGKPVRTATGPNDRPGGSEALAPDGWEVGEFIGKTAVIQIVDQATGGWGHINIDQIVQSDRKPAGMMVAAQREFTVRKRYLNLPGKMGAPQREVSILVDGKVVAKQGIELADGEPDGWMPMDVSAWRGKTITLQVGKLPGDSKALSSIEPGDSIKQAPGLYREPLRGQFHFSAKRGWLNDPNGLSFYNGEYHLFYQHNPFGWGWGNMHWGHAISKDLVHWEELPLALAPDALGTIFSGSAVVDWNNTSGFGTPKKPPHVLLYTAAGNPFTQGIAYSTDGRTYTKYSGNPIVKEISGGNRDPKVIWYEPTKQWVMTLWVDWNKAGTIHFLTSPNLKDWTIVSHTDGFYECPDFFELPVDGEAAKKKWVLTGADSGYMVGTFDGTTFTPETPKLPGHRGRGFYAAQTFSDLPAKDGRRIQIGWFQTETKGMPFNQSMSIPLELKLISTTDGPRLTWTPVKELNSLRGKTHKLAPLTLKPDTANPLAKVKTELVELRAEFEPGEAGEIVFIVRGASIVYDAKKQELAVNGHRVPAPLRDGKQRLTIYCDRTGLDVFASDGLTYVPMPFQPKADDLALGVEAKTGTVKITKLEVYELKSAWK